MQLIWASHPVELDSFAYAVSHDLRAPLRAMNGFSEALQEDYGDGLDGEAKEYLNEIAGASRHMGELIDGLLLLSRSTRGTLRDDPIGGAPGGVLGSRERTAVEARPA